MLCTVVNDILRTSQICEISIDARIKALTYGNVVVKDCYVTCNGKIQDPDAALQHGQVYHLVPRLVGGKGGFGSMLRAIGAQIEKTTNHEACRDLSGRRMRDVNNEKKLKEWVGKAADRERERQEKRRERMERRRATPKHMFHDPQYQETKTKVLENLDNALREGLQKSTTASGTATKRKATATTTSATSSKKSKAEWLGIDIDDLSDSDDDEDDSESGSAEASPVNDEAQPSCSGSTDLVTQGSRQKDDTSSSSSSSGSPRHVTDDKGEESSTMNGRVEDEMDTHTNSSDRNNESTEKKEESKTHTPETDSTSGSGLLATLAKTPPKQQMEQQKTEEKVTEVDLDSYSSAEELEAVGLEGLKAALMVRGLKCGGTLQERAARLFSVKGLTPDQIDPSLKSKGGKVKKSKGK